MLDDATTDEGRLLDRLVDGELDDIERRQLLSALDTAPGGWRRCAMAFLQTQAWQRAMNDAVESREDSPGQSVLERQAVWAENKRQPASSTGRSRVFDWLSLAGCVLVAFSLGVVSQRGSPRESTGGSASVVTSDLPERQDGAVGAPPGENILAQSPNPGRPIPLVGAEAPAGQVVRDRDLAGIADLLEQLERSGYQVHRQQGILPFNRQDGRRVIVPVEDYYIVPVRGTTY